MSAKIPQHLLADAVLCVRNVIGGKKGVMEEEGIFFFAKNAVCHNEMEMRMKI